METLSYIDLLWGRSMVTKSKMANVSLLLRLFSPMSLKDGPKVAGHSGVSLCDKTKIAARDVCWDVCCGRGVGSRCTLASLGCLVLSETNLLMR